VFVVCLLDPFDELFTMWLKFAYWDYPTLFWIWFFLPRSAGLLPSVFRTIWPRVPPDRVLVFLCAWWFAIWGDTVAFFRHPFRHQVNVLMVNLAQDDQQPDGSDSSTSPSDDDSVTAMDARTFPDTMDDTPTRTLLNLVAPTADTTTVEPTIAPKEGYHWWHVDTGANAMVTNRLTDLIAPIAVNATAGSAQKGVSAEVTAMGELQLSGIDMNDLLFQYRSRSASHVPAFHRRSLSGHEMKRNGWRFLHEVVIWRRHLAAIR